MIRSIPRALLRSSARPTKFVPARSVNGRRFISTDPPHLKSRSWKNSAMRWGLAAAGIYYYNTSPVFAEQPQYNLLNPNVDALEDENSSATLDALTASSRRKSQKGASILQSAVENVSDTASQPETSSSNVAHPETDIPAIDGSPSDLEEEAEGQGAFNPVTGEINWDCPCLGGMAHGPCGPEFRDAFSCFVYSTEEPKGMDCIDKFQNMQTCFRAHPDVYKGELEDDEELDAELAQEREELKTQIAERKAAEREQEQVSGNRLLEEPRSGAPAEKKKKASKKSASRSEAPSSNKSDGRPDQAPQPSIRTASSSEPHPGLSEEHEAINEGQRSVIKNDVYTKSIDASSVVEEEGDIVPKAAHDSTDAPVPKASKGSK